MICYDMISVRNRRTGKGSGIIVKFHMRNTFFEKENVNILDAKGEVLLTILSSLTQDEIRSISENCTWGICRRFEQGKHAFLLLEITIGE